MVGPTSRAWYEELRLAPVVADALRSRGLDEGVAWWAAERVRTLLDLPLPSMLGGPARTLPLRLVDAWLSHPAVRPFIRVNAWDGVEWFHRESWDELLAWVERLEWILSPEDARPARPVERSALETTLTDAADASGYRVDRLREALGARPAILAEPESRSWRRAGARAGAASPSPEPELARGLAPATTAKVQEGREAQEVVQGGQGQEPQEVEVGPADATLTRHRVGLPVPSRRWGRIPAGSRPIASTAEPG